MSSTITVKDKQFKPYLSADAIAKNVADIATQINSDYEGGNPLFIAILNGSFMFASDLYKQITVPSQITFVKVASYSGTTSTGKVMTLLGLDMDITDRHVVLIEDIVDTGKTLSELIPHLQHSKPASIQIAALLQKPDALKHPLDVKYVGFRIPNDFIVGYGLDYDGYGRNLKDIYQVC